MTDLEIIEVIEKEIGIKLIRTKNGEFIDKCYEIDVNDNVISISLRAIGSTNVNKIYRYVCALKNLKRLSLERNQIYDITHLSTLTNLYRLDLSDNQITDIKPLVWLVNLSILSLSRNQISDISPLSELNNLFFLSISNNKIYNIDPLHGLNKLSYLYISKNLISNISALSKLPHLSTLHINDNKLVDIYEISNCKGIIVLDVSNNPLDVPPHEIATQGIKAIRKYFEEKKKQGEEKLYEAKIVIVGAGESGKTTLIRKLKNPAHSVPNLKDKRTQGIRVSTYPFETEIGRKKIEIKAHLWDFGGQELYHTTHQLFLTADTLYILLNDNRKNDTDFYYWLNIVTLRAGGKCPILMVFNAKDNAPRQIIPGEEIFNAFPNVVPQAIDVNFADKDLTGIVKMKNTIESYFSKLEVLGKPFPAYWVRVRETLGKLGAECIKWDEYADICKKNGIDDLQQMQILATTLHNLGVLLYFPEVFGLKDLIILKSQWCVDAIYSALDTEAIIKNAGKFNKGMLAEKWSIQRFAGKELQLLELMQHFDLCYRIDGSYEYIAPQLLPIEENRYTGMPATGAIVFRFDYTFMPAGLITRLIARMSRHIKAPYVWRTGVTLEWEEGTIAEVTEHQLTHQISIRINGRERKRRLAEIRRTLYDLHKDFRGLKFEELVSCNCIDCQKGVNVTTFPLTDLEAYDAHGLDMLCRNGTWKSVVPRNIIEGISYEDKPRIFISYSHKNEALKDEFRTMIHPMEKEGHWQVWDDRWLLPNDEWNREILKHLDEANVMVLMLTKEFFGSDYIYDIELSRAIKRHEQGDALLVGIVVSDCMWEKTPLSRIQILPKDAHPVEKNQHRDEVWKAAAKTIEETINVWQGKQGRRGGW